MRFLTLAEAAAFIRGKRVAVVGSAPSVLDNREGFVDSHEVVVRVNNYKPGRQQGVRCDVFYSFHGGSIRKSAADLKADGVYLCMCKCPNAKPIESPWHERQGKQGGVDFRYIYEMRKNWWFCDTYVPTVARFLETFHLLKQHVPSTGFAAILDVLACEPLSVYLTGFDFFASRIHNVDEHWRPGDPADPIGHRPQLEAEWLAANCGRHPLTFDPRLGDLMNEPRRRAAFARSAM